MSIDPPILAARDVHKTYRLGRVDVPVLRGVSIEVQAGEFVAIVGASGSGKSTLLHLLGGLDRPDERGHARNSGIEFKGRPLREFSQADLDGYRASSVGFVFQFYHLLPELTVLENVLLAGMVRHGRWRYATQRSALHALAQDLLGTFGLAERLEHRPSELSGGERQRVAIARALLNRPAVLLADEPTGNLDRTTGGHILDAMIRHRTQTGQTIVMVTHDAEVARRADRAVRLVDGHVDAAPAVAPAGPHP